MFIRALGSVVVRELGFRAAERGAQHISNGPLGRPFQSRSPIKNGATRRVKSAARGGL